MPLSTAMESKMIEFSNTIIMHPQYAAAIEKLLHGMEATRLRKEPCCALLLGDPGTGKSTACTQLINMVGGQRTVLLEGGQFKQVLAFDCPVPATYSIIDLCTEMLKALGDDPPVAKLATLQNRLFRLLKTCGTKLIIIDEVHDLLNPSAVKTWQNVCKWIKYVANSTAIPIILSGKTSTESLIDKHEELAGRYPYRARLSNLKYDSIFMAVLLKLNTEMSRIGNFSKPLHITDSKISCAFYLHTLGNMRSLRTLLYEIMHIVLTREGDEVTVSDCATAARLLNDGIEPYTNPFEVSAGTIQKLMEQLKDA